MVKKNTLYIFKLKTMPQDINIIEINSSNLDRMTEFAYRHQNAPYYLAYETTPHIPLSTLQRDLKWLRKCYGIKGKDGKGNENAIITRDSLNDGRRNEISNYQLCLDLNVPMWELNNYDKENKCWHIIHNPFSGDEVEYKPTKLTNRKQFEDNISWGLLVLCKIIEI